MLTNTSLRVGVRLRMSMMQFINHRSSENLLFTGPKGIHLGYILSYLIFPTLFKIGVIIPITMKG